MSQATNDPFGLVGGVLDEKYEVAAVVAEGGFGVVYRASHLGLAKTVALKVLKVPTELSAGARQAYLEKFQQEARLIAALEHPAIVRVIDYGASPMPHGATAPWMVLEWLEGSTLEAVLEARGGQGMPPAEVLRFLEPVFAAIGLAHDEGIAHRDLKPANLMQVRSKRGEISLKVLDFGIAKFSDEAERAGEASGATRTSSKMVTFSLQYAAPEQVSGLRTGAWTDVHALALIVVELLTGRPALLGSDMSELYAAVLGPVRPTPASRGVDVGAWEPVLARALGFKPAERPRDAHALLQALKESLPGARWQPCAATGPGVAGAHPNTLVTGPEGFQGAPSTLRGAEVAATPTTPSRRGPIAVAVAVAVVFAAVATGSLLMRGSTEAPVASPTPAAAVMAAAAAPVVPPQAPSALPSAAPAVAVDAGVAPAPATAAPVAPAAPAAPRAAPVARGLRPARTPILPRAATAVPAGPQAIPLE